MILDRTIAPNISETTLPKLIPPIKKMLLNSVPLYAVHGGSQELLRLEIIFQASIINQQKIGVASAVASLLKEGTSKKTATEIAELFDYYGAFIETECGRDQSTIAIFCLNKQLKPVLALLNELIHDAIFPASELALYVNTQKQRLATNLTKVDFQSRIIFSQKLFGKVHPYGSSIEDAAQYDALNQNDLKNFYNTFYLTKPKRIVVSGFINDEVIKTIEQEFTFKSIEIENKKIEVIKNEAIILHKQIPGAIQSGIRIGKILFNKTHEHYVPMSILVTILGGYFGSRLMKNIREEKGYTYGIGANLVSLHQAGYMVIGTEVGKEVTQEAIKEIYKEMEMLKTEKVSAQELQTVKNYMLGVFLRNTDGAFAQADRLNSVLDWHLDYQYYEQYFEKVKKCNANDLINLANEHFNTFIQVVASDV